MRDWHAWLVVGIVLAVITASVLGASAARASASVADVHRARAVRAAEYILRCQDPNGAIRDAFDNPAVNMDNNMGYAMVGLAAAFQATGDARYLDAVRRGLVWLASIQEADGAWHWGYLAPDYRPFVSEYYRNLHITDIKGVDAIQAYYAYTLYLYVSLSGDRAFGETMLPVARRGIDYLIGRNYDGRFFFSSWQQRGRRWNRLSEQFSAGQGDVYLGLAAMWRLTGEPRYQEIAARLQAALPMLSPRGVWVTSTRNSSPYRFSNGYLPYIFQSASGISWLAAHQDGSAIAAAALAVGQRANGIAPDEALATLADLQGAQGGVAFSKMPPFDGYYYTNDAAFAILAWLAAPFASSGLPPSATARSAQ